MWAEVKNVMRARVVSGFLLLIALASPAFAADRQAEGRPSFDRILPEIRRHTPGTFYNAEGPFIGPDGQARYRIKWMTPDGRIVWYEVDAHNGRILGMVTGTLPLSSSRRDRGSEGYLPPYPADGDRYGRDRYDNDRDYGDGRGNSNHFGNYGWPGYDRGQGRDGDRGDRGDRDGNGGGWHRGGSDRGNSGRGDSRRGHRDRN
jgi:hypothetical protein